MPDAAWPRVSVIIPTFNRSSLLAKAIRSAVAQTFSDLEVIVSDNGSSDSTAEVVASFDDPRIRYMPLRRNVGLIGNLNRCLGLGRAPYLTFLHDDDVMRPDNVAAKLAILEQKPDVAFVHSAFSLIDADDREIRPWMSWGLPIEEFEPGPVFISRVFSAGSRVCPSGTLVRRSMLADVRCEEEEGAANDVGMWLRIARNGAVAYISDPLVELRRHAGATTVATGVRDGYRPTFESAIQVRLVKDRFLRNNDIHPLSPATLHALARRASRGELTAALENRAALDKSRARFLRDAVQAVRIERSLPVSADFVELVVSHLLGPRWASVVHATRVPLREVRAHWRAT